MVDMAHIAGLVAAGLHPSPIPYAHVTTTTTHKTLRGPRGGMILSSQEFADEYKLNKAIFPGIQGGPLMHIIAGKAVALGECLKPEFKAYAAQIVANAQALAKELLAQGFALVSGGTDNHLMLVDVSVLGLTGKAVEQALDKAGISVNKNAIPFDKQKPMVTSGIRIGTPSVTTRGMKEAEMVQIARFIKKACDNIDNDAALAALRDEVYAFTAKFPMYK